MPRQRNNARRHMELKRRVWWFRIGIPDDCQPYFGRGGLHRENLQTGDIRIAMERRDEAERAFHVLVRKIRAGEAVAPSTLTARDRGEAWREAVADLRRDPDSNRSDEGEESPASLAMSLAEEEAERLSRRERREFTKALVGNATIDEHLEPYLKAIKLASKTTDERRGLLKRFARWCDKEGLRLPGVDRKAAGRYVTAEIEPMHFRTAKKHMTALRGYWDYLTIRGHVPGAVMSGKAVESPWLAQMLPNNKRRVEHGEKDSDERPFTTEELQTLLYADYPAKVGEEFQQQIADALRMSCLSGMRLAEVITLWVEDVHDDLFDLQQGKTGNAPRKVPIHSDLKEIVARRTKDKEPRGWLFHELVDKRNPGDTFGKRFNRYRKALGVDDKRDGHRRSLVNFHSCRRWFTTQAEMAGIPETTTATVIGHSEGRKGQTYGGYSGGPSEEQRRACVEAVKLPGAGT